MKPFKTLLGLFFISAMVLLGACKGDDEPSSGGNFSFVSTGLSFNGSKYDFKTNAPYSGKTYNFKIKADEGVKWNVAVKSGDFLSVSPEGEQSGNGEFSVIVAENKDKTPGKEGVVAITNTANDRIVTITFIQLEKKLYFPDGLEGQRQEDFYKADTQWNVNYMLEGDDIAIIWDKAFGTDPKYGNTITDRRFDADKMMEIAEQAYYFIRNDLRFASKSNSIVDRYKLLLVVKNDSKTSASGGGINVSGGPDDLPGLPILWVRPFHLNAQGPTYNVIYHEMSHSFQVLCEYDGAHNLKTVGDGKGIGSFYEMTSQWTLLQRYPDWLRLEPAPFNEFLERTHLALGHNELQYRNVFVPEYWATKHGVDIISKIWQNTTADDGGDFVRAYMRLTGTDQKTFNAEIFEAATRFITWDLPYIDKEYNGNGGGNIHTCKLTKSGNVFRIAKERCPQNYGYNGICLKSFTPGQKVTVKFTGLTNASGYTIKRPERAEWRWGFVASLADGKRVYSDAGCGKSGETSFTVPANTKYLWLVVAATPTEYWFELNNEWPYQFEITGAQPDGNLCKVN